MWKSCLFWDCLPVNWEMEMRAVMSFHVRVQVWLCFCLGLTSCFSVHGCQQNASAPCHGLSPQPSSSSSSFLGPPFSRVETPLPAGRAFREHYPGRGPLQGQGGFGESQGKLTALGAGWHVQQAVQAGPLECVTGGHPHAIAEGWVLNQKWGVLSSLALTLPPRAAGKGLHGKGNQEGPYPPWIK